MKTDKKSIEAKEQRTAENIWFRYFNDYLFQNKIITEKEYCRMNTLITEKIAKAEKHTCSGNSTKLYV